MFCAVSIDDVAGNDLATIDRGLERARDRGEVIQLYGHAPGGDDPTVPVEKVEAILAKAAELGLAFYTEPELVPGGAGTGGLALSFDDAHVDEWWAMRDVFARYDARVTFFITRYDRWDDAMKAELRDLRSDGHSIQAHSVNHLRAPEYVSDHGLAAYLADEAMPSIDWLITDGYPVTDYAYPFGARTGELDHALLQHVQRVRAVTFAIDGVVADSCPE